VSTYNTFADITAHLDRLGLFHMDLGLERMRGFARRFSLAAGATGPVAHVVGTNGKGSTAAFLESMARAHGLRTGLHTSPHFTSVRERIRVGGEMLAEGEWVHLANRLDALAGDLGLTYFEWLTCLSALAFDEARAELAVMEAGLGGRFDATRVFDPAITLLTPVDLDHVHVLGSTLEEIADDKSRAIRSGGVAVTAAQEPEVMAVYERRAAEVGARLVVAGKAAAGLALGLQGPHQRANAGLALAAWELLAPMLGMESRPEAVALGLASAWLPGRFQVLEGCREVGEGLPTVILDGAHNVHGLRGLGAALADAGLRPEAVVFACMADKDAHGMAREVLALAEGPVLLPAFEINGRALPARHLESVFAGRGRPEPSLASALAGLCGARSVMVCGSLYLLAEFYKLHPRFLNPQTREDA
jgi:dihydrofolate synthase/folylpolyglutamate synthase